jgi:hypothetical protein
MLNAEGPQTPNAATKTAADRSDRVCFARLYLSGEHADAAPQIVAVERMITVITSSGRGGKVIPGYEPWGITQYGFWRCAHGGVRLQSLLCASLSSSNSMLSVAMLGPQVPIGPNLLTVVTPLPTRHISEAVEEEMRTKYMCLLEASRLFAYYSQDWNLYYPPQPKQIFDFENVI